MNLPLQTRITLRKFANSFVVLALGFAMLGADKPSALLPATGKDIQKLNYLAGLEDALPKIFDQPPPHDFNILEVMNQQAKVLSELQKSPRYLKHSEHDLIQFTVSPGSATAVDAAAVSAWKNNLLAALGHYDPTRPINAQIDSKLKKLAAEIGAGSSQGFKTGLINTLSKEDRASVFKMEGQAQIEKLLEILPNDLSSAGFKGEFYGMPSQGVTRSHALEVLAAKLKTEAEFNQTLQLQLALQGMTQPANRLNDAQKALKQLSDERVFALSNKKDLEAAVSVSPVGNQKNPTWFSDLDRSMKSLVKTRETSPLISKSIRLTELPPTVGVFRGYLGGDCSTKYSCGYVWGPDERTFMISGEDGVRKGYVSGTIVKTDGKASYYIHSINGAKVSNAETRAILQGFDQVTREMGVKNIVIATKTASSTINYPEIRDAFTAYSNGKPEVSLKYRDSYARSKIDALMEGSYDRVGVNQVGSVVETDAAITPLTVQLEKNSVHFAAKDISRERALLLAIDFKSVGQNAVADKIIEAMGRSPRAFDKTFLLLKNPEHLKTEEYLSEVGKRFATWDLKLDSELLAKKKSWFNLGLMNASDSLAPENQKRAVGAVFDQLPNNRIPKETFDFLADHQAVLKNDSRFWPTLKKLTQEYSPHYKTIVEKLEIMNELTGKVPGWFADSSDPVVQARTLGAMGNLADKASIPILVQNLDHPNLEVRKIAQMNVRALYSNHKELVAPVVEKMMRSENRALGIEAGNLMAASGLYRDDRDLQNFLFKHINDPDSRLRNLATSGFGQTNITARPDALEIMETMRDSEYPESRRVVANKLQLLEAYKNDPRIFFKFEKLLSDSDPLTRNFTLNAFPANELNAFLAGKNDLTPYAALVAKAKPMGPFDVRLYGLFEAALESDNPQTRMNVLGQLKGMTHFPQTLEAKIRKLLVPGQPTLINALFALESAMTPKDEKAVLKILLSQDQQSVNFVGQWLGSTQYVFQDKNNIKAIVELAQGDRRVAFSSVRLNAMSYAMKNGSESTKQKVFMAAIRSEESNTRLSAARTWLTREKLPAYGSAEMKTLIASAAGVPYGQLVKHPEFWSDPEWIEAFSSLIDKTIPQQCPNFFHLLSESGVIPAGNPDAYRLLKQAFRRMPEDSQIQTLTALVKGNNWAPETVNMRKFGLELRLTTNNTAMANAAEGILNLTGLDDAAEVPALMQRLSTAKEMNVLSSFFVNGGPNEAVAAALIKHAPDKFKNTEAFWDVIRRVSNPADAKFQWELATLVSKSKADSMIRAQGLAMLAEHPSEVPEIKNLVELATREPAAKLKLPVNCANQIYTVLQSI